MQLLRGMLGAPQRCADMRVGTDGLTTTPVPDPYAICRAF